MFEFDPKFVAKAQEMRDAGQNPYPQGFAMPTTLTDVLKNYAQDVYNISSGELTPGQKCEEAEYTVGGRVMFRNRMGKILFLRIEDRDGKIQLMAMKPEVGEENYELMKSIDIGDWVWCRGYIMRTEAGELTIRVRELRLASKIMTSFPDRHNGFNDVEAKSRQRYLDLMMNEDTRDTFIKRSKIVAKIRNHFNESDYLEVETPILNTIPGGATAKPFTTHHHALDSDLYLRIAPELYLKRLLVGGLDRVFEIGKNFRNEGLSSKHNPEFTMIEFYRAWATYHDMMNETEDLIRSLSLVKHVQFGDVSLNFHDSFRRVSMENLVGEFTGLMLSQLCDADALREWWCRTNIKDNNSNQDLPNSWAKWWEFIFNEYIESTLIQPTFVTGFPIEISPLARRSDSDFEIADRFELYIAGNEIANGFSELNSSQDQAARFEEQVKEKNAGNNEAMFFDHDYITALTYGLPPCAGCGIGIDRLVMLLTNNQTIKEVILFPTMKSI